MTLKGLRVAVKGEKGTISFTNNVKDDITIEGNGRVVITFDQFEEIFNSMKKTARPEEN